MFKEVLAIGGKPGLFKLVSYAKNYVIVESLIDGKRQPAYQSEKISLLRDIVMFGNGGEKKLSQLFKATFELESGAKVDIDTKNSNALQDFFAKIFPDFDRERIYPNDIKKFVSWYNILIDSKITDFDEVEEEQDNNETGKEKKPQAERADKPKTAAPKNTAKKVSTKSAAPKQATRVSMKKGS
jgi:hypothetical protein